MSGSLQGCPGETGPNPSWAALEVALTWNAPPQRAMGSPSPLTQISQKSEGEISWFMNQIINSLYPKSLLSPILLYLNTQHIICQSIIHSSFLHTIAVCLSVCLPMRTGTSSCSLLSTQRRVWPIEHAQCSLNEHTNERMKK